jgi:hypothetical protein
MMRAVTEHGLWYAMPVLAGDRIRLEPLSVEHADGYLEAAGGAAEIFRRQSPPGAKLLMLGYAFGPLGAVRVSLVTDILNQRARAAIEQLGARQDGVQRKHRRRADGSWRDTVMYAIVDDDWPAVRGGLLKRLGDAA